MYVIKRTDPRTGEVQFVGKRSSRCNIRYVSDAREAMRFRSREEAEASGFFLPRSLEGFTVDR